jgi:glycosyltransferase involved in cell wall biosynthesis
MSDVPVDPVEPAGRPGRAPRVAVLWARLSGYLHACLRELADQGVDLLVVHQQAATDAPFDPEAISAGFRSVQWADAPDAAAIGALLDEHDPDVILASSWNFPAYRTVCRAREGRTLRIFGMDNQWLGTPKQWLGVATARWVLRPTYDGAFLCDERQAAFAARLGFPAERLVWGLYAGDQPLFAQVAARRGAELPPRQFLFVGRLVPEKGIDVLVDAYRRYRAEVDEPWSLGIAGTGPEQHRLDSVDGIKRYGFVQPADLPAVFEEAGCLVLPSRFEPWAVVIHEAAAAGLPIVCSRACGASVRLVLDGYNGAVVSTGDAEALARALLRIHRLTDDQRRAMGAASSSLSLQYSPRQWAERLLERVPQLRAAIGLTPEPWL